MRSLAVVGMLAAAACTRSPEAEQQIDGGESSGPWVSRTRLQSEPVIVERVVYLSDGLHVGGELCRPTGAGPYPVVVRLHGGFDGIGSDERQFCQAAAASGYAVIVPSYRGEDGGEGAVEVCLGEVNDAQAMIVAARAEPWVAEDRFVLFGASHGGCITLELALREPWLKAAVDFFGPADWQGLFGWWSSQRDAGEPFCTAIGEDPERCDSEHAELMSIVSTATGGEPVDRSAAYVARSPAARLAGLSVPTMLVHGENDYWVNLDQSCGKRLALESGGAVVDSWFLSTEAQPLQGDDPRTSYCGGFRTDALPDDLDSDFYWLVYEGQGHGFLPGSAAEAHAGEAALRFLFNRL